VGCLAAEAPFGPRLLGVDLDREVIVLRDLGQGTSLSDLLIASDPLAAETGLRVYARTLGRQHAVTAGQEELFAAIKGKCALTQTRAWSAMDSRANEDLVRFRSVCASLDVPIDGTFDKNVESIWHHLANPEPFLTYNIGDACPDKRRCPAAEDRRRFNETMLSACAYWTLRTVSWTVVRVFEEDDSWGLLSHRQRHVHRLAKALRKRWPEIEAEMLLYPAFPQ
jgi:hypothetical protein